MIVGPGVRIFLPPKTGTTYIVRECETRGWKLHRSKSGTQHTSRSTVNIKPGTRLICTRRNVLAWYRSLYEYLHTYQRPCLGDLPIQAPFDRWLMMVLDADPRTARGPARIAFENMRRLGCGLATYRLLQTASPLPIERLTSAALPGDVEWLWTEHLDEQLAEIWKAHGLNSQPSGKRVKVSKRRDDIRWTSAMLDAVYKADGGLFR